MTVHHDYTSFLFSVSEVPDLYKRVGNVPRVGDGPGTRGVEVERCRVDELSTRSTGRNKSLGQNASKKAYFLELTDLLCPQRVTSLSCSSNCFTGSRTLPVPFRKKSRVY